MVILSPHADDAALSLGATLRRLARRGFRVEVVTVFGGDPTSEDEAGPWDARSGFASQGEAARIRREEDARACAHLGVVASWLPFADRQYEPRDDEGVIWSAIARSYDGADALLVPGFPLAHPDHARLARLVLRRRPSGCRFGLYAEQPYALEASPERREAANDRLLELTGETPTFHHCSSGPRELLAKWRAIGEYRSQLPLRRGRPGSRRAVSARFRFAILRAHEAVAWLSERYA